MRKFFNSLVMGLMLLMLVGADQVLACTSAIITGKLTADGRPMLLKHRDTGELNNRIEKFTGKKYSFIGLVDSPSEGGCVWAGTNEVGFSIVNTASYNLKDDDIREMDKEGELMYKALGECRTLKDFERFLDKYPRPMRVEANFGVIDAEGGAAYYEVNNTKWTKIDVNDPKIAPEGFLAVTNFSYTGRPDEGMGYVRYHTAQQVLMEKAFVGVITPHWVFSNISRSFRHSLLGIDLRKDAAEAAPQGWFIDQDFIPRRSTSASVLIQGVKPGENAALTTMWTVLGYPPVAVALPLFVNAPLPQGVVKNGATGRSAYCDLALEAKKSVFPMERGNGKKYFNFNVLYNDQGTGWMQKMEKAEQQLQDAFEPLMQQFRQQGRLVESDLMDYYEDAHSFILNLYTHGTTTLH